MIQIIKGGGARVWCPEGWTMNMLATSAVLRPVIVWFWDRLGLLSNCTRSEVEGAWLATRCLYCSVLQCTAVYNQGLMPVMLAWQYSALSQYDILFLWGETELLTWQSECWLLVGDVVISPPGTAARLESCLQWPGLLMIQFRRSLSSLASCGFRFLCWTLSSHIHIQYILEKIKKSNELVIVDSGHLFFIWI